MPTRNDVRRAAIARIAPLDADLLLVHALGISKETLYAHPEIELSDDEVAHIEMLVRRRAAGEPVAYLRGFKEFYGLELAVDARVLIPRPETEILVDAALAFIRRSGARLVADIGTGSGAIAIALAVNAPDLQVIGIDSSEGALEVARKNAERHRVADRVEFRVGDLFGPLVEKVDVVVANLPYLRHDRGERPELAFEPAAALYAGIDGLSLIRKAAGELSRVLRPVGAAYFELDPGQAPEVVGLLDSLGGTVRVLHDLAGDARVALMERMEDLRR